MANRRMISKSISVSEQVNGMSLLARLLFTWMIPHADDWGRMPGSSRTIRALVIPLGDVNDDQVDGALSEMEAAGLIRRYRNGGSQFLYFPKWEDHQTGLHKRTSSKYPDPPKPTLKPATSRKFREVPASRVRAEPNLTEPNLTEQKRSTPAGPADKPPVQRLTALFIDLYREAQSEKPATTGKTIGGILKPLVKDFGEEEVERRMRFYFASTGWIRTKAYSIQIFKIKFNELRDGPEKIGNGKRGPGLAGMSELEQSRY